MVKEKIGYMLREMLINNNSHRYFLTLTTVFLLVLNSFISTSFVLHVDAQTLGDTTPPEIKNVSANPSCNVSTGNINLSCVVVDDQNVSGVFLKIWYPNNKTENFSIAQNRTDGNIYFCEKPYQPIGRYIYQIWADDSSGNNVTSSKYYFKIRSPLKIEKKARNSSSDWMENITQFKCGKIRFNITITNQNLNNHYLYDIRIRDYLPRILMYSANSTINGKPVEPTSNENGKNLTWDLSKYGNITDNYIAPGESKYLEFDAIITEDGKEANRVTVEATEENSGKQVSNDTANITGIQHGLKIEKKVWNTTTATWTENISAKPGDIITYKINVTSKKFSMNKIEITDILPSRLFKYLNNSATVNNMPRNPLINDRNLTWNVTSLQPNETILIKFKTLISENKTITLKNQATVTAFVNNVKIRENDTSNITLKPSKISFKKFAWDPQTQRWVNHINATPGEKINFKIILENKEGTYFDLWINDSFPDNLVYAGGYTSNEKENMTTQTQPDNKTVKWHYTKPFLQDKKIEIEFKALVTRHGYGENQVDASATQLGIKKHWFANTIINSAPRLKITNPSARYIKNLKNITGWTSLKNVSTVKIMIFNKTGNTSWNGTTWRENQTTWFNAKILKSGNITKKWYFKTQNIKWVYNNKYVI